MTCIAAAMMFAASVCGACDANLADFPRLAGETDDSPRFVRAISAAPNGVLCVPKGEYDIGSMILITNRCSLSMHPAAHLVARAKMKYVLFWDGAAGCEKLYEGKGKNVDWIGSTASGGDGMAADAARLFPQNPPCRPRQ